MTAPTELAIQAPTFLAPVSDEPDPEAICASCPHPVYLHDPIAARYCAATHQMTGGRGCICKNEKSQVPTSNT